MTALYLSEDGRQITTNSMIKTFHRCPKQTQYKYLERLKPRTYSKPLTRGKWLHSLWEAYYKGESWTAVHKQLTIEFNKLFDEEKEELGDLPKECAALMRSYLWHYGANKEDKFHGWEIVDVERTIETTLPDGSTYRGRCDLLIRDEYGLWLVDHKSHKSLPDLTFRMLDMQSALYLWALRRGDPANGVPPMDIQGFIWNYMVTKPPSIPELLKDGTRLSRRKINTDYPTLVKAIRDHNLNPEDYRSWIDLCKRDRWAPGVPQTSPFFRREILEKDDELLDRLAREMFHAKQRMDEYDFSDIDAVERVPDRSCRFMCSYNQLCTAEMFGNGDFLRRKMFTIQEDMLDYYPADEERDRD